MCVPAYADERSRIGEETDQAITIDQAGHRAVAPHQLRVEAVTQTEALTQEAAPAPSRGGRLAGVVAHVAASHAWVQPLGPVPFEMKAKLSAINSELRAGEAERGCQFCCSVTNVVMYVALADVEENSLVLKPGMIVLFQI